MDEEEERQQQYLAQRDAIFMLLCSGHYCYLSDRMQVFYQTWSVLPELQKKRLNEYVSCYMPVRHAPLYESMIEVFTFWDKTQDSVGAPGWDCRDDLVYLENTDLESEIRQMLFATESLWKKFSKLSFQCSSQTDEPNAESGSDLNMNAENESETNGYTVKLRASPKSLDVSIGMKVINKSSTSGTSICCPDSDEEDLKETISRCSESREKKKMRFIEEDLQCSDSVRKSYSAELLR